MEKCIRIVGNMVYLDIKALPGASKSAIVGVQEGRLRVKIAAAAEDGRANAELCSFLAKLLGCPKKEVNLRFGEKSRLKTVALPLGLKEKIIALGCRHR
ncbi:MAG: DUF167 domain-containing protein [Treponema sp.]|jgi:uncharacterized protein (TIGR00251 family)|nr:DUF167 domain-containing protein [Treponema sp.]